MLLWHFRCSGAVTVTDVKLRAFKAYIKPTTKQSKKHTAVSQEVRPQCRSRSTRFDVSTWTFSRQLRSLVEALAWPSNQVLPMLFASSVSVLQSAWTVHRMHACMNTCIQIHAEFFKQYSSKCEHSPLESQYGPGTPQPNSPLPHPGFCVAGSIGV